MSCRVAVRRDDGSTGCLTDDQVATLLGLALEEDEDTFKELARCLGVGADTVDDLWTRTVARVARGLSTSASSRSRPRPRREDRPAS